MSYPAGKPKVFKVPSEKPKAHVFYVQKLKDWAQQNRSKAVLLSSAGVLLFLIALQSSMSLPGKDRGSAKNEEKFTFFGPSDSNAATIGQPFVIKGKNNSIIGQITQMAAEEQDAEPLNNTRNVDNQADQELLSVVNKH